MDRAEMDRRMDEHFGFEARDDVAGVLSTLAPDVTHDIVGWPEGPTQGRENARPFYETLFADLADGKVVCERRLYGENFLVDESTWEGRAPGRPAARKAHALANGASSAKPSERVRVVSSSESASA